MFLHMEASNVPKIKVIHLLTDGQPSTSNAITIHKTPSLPLNDYYWAVTSPRPSLWELLHQLLMLLQLLMYYCYICIGLPQLCQHYHRYWDLESGEHWTGMIRCKWIRPSARTARSLTCATLLISLASPRLLCRLPLSCFSGTNKTVLVGVA